ncbi:MAG: hypothetical protein V1708_05760 [Candidatus Micrarchaeota archaeon]
MNRAARKAQAGLEMFLVFSIALLILFWFSNYLAMFTESIYGSGLNQQQRLANRNLAVLANEVCATGVNLSVKAPCLTRGSDSILYRVFNKSDGQEIYIYNAVSGFESHESINCKANVIDTGYIQCSSFEKICMKKDALNYVLISRGACD